MVSNKLLGVLLIIVLLVGIGAGYAASSLFMSPSSTAPTQKIIKIGAIFDLSGSASFLGPGETDAAQLAVSDMNNNLAKGGSPMQFALVVQDSGSLPDTAKSAYQSLVASGIQEIIGFALSSCLAEVIPLAPQDKVTVIASSSGSAALAIPKPYVYRMAGIMSGNETVALLNFLGKKNVVVIYRQDAWGNSISQAIKQEFSGQTALIGYPQTGYAMGGIAATADQAVRTFGVNNSTAVVSITFEDDGVALAVAASSYPALSSVQWIGGTGLTGSSELKGNPVAAKFLEGMYMFGFGFSQSNPAFSAYAAEAMAANKTDATVSEVPFTYDAAMLGMMAIVVAGNNGTAINEILPSLATHYNGITGIKTFNAVNDQLFQDWFLVRFVTINGKQDYYLYGIYVGSSNSLVEYPTPTEGAP